MNVYFARSIRGQHKPGDQAFFQAIVETIKACGHTPSLETPTTYKGHVERDRFIYLRDLEWIFNADAMVAEVSNPSLGVGYEIAYAQHVVKIPILCVALKDEKVSAMITGGLKVFYYRDLSHVEGQIKTFLESIQVYP